MRDWLTFVRLVALLACGFGSLVACGGDSQPAAPDATPPPASEPASDQQRQGGAARSEPGRRAQAAPESLDDQDRPAQATDAQAQRTEAGPPEQPEEGPGEDTTESDVGPFYVAPEDVDVRDWVQSYDYGLPEAEPGESLSAVSTLTANPLIPEYHLLRVVVTAPLVEDETPFNVTLLLDPGGAMADEEHASAARLLASRILEGLRPERDRAAVVWFPEGGERPEAIRHSESDWRALSEAITNFQPSTQADIRQALDLAAQTADQARSEWPDSHHYVVFVSDGSLELASHDPFAALGPGGDYDALNPLRFEAYGIGLRHFEGRALERLGHLGNGGAFFYRTPGLVMEHFDAATWRRDRIPYGEEASMLISINPETTSGQRILLSQENFIENDVFGEDRPDLSALPAGSQFIVYLFVELQQPPEPAQELHVGQMEVRWLSPGSRETNRQELPFVASVSEWGEDPGFAFGGIVAMSTFLYGFFADETVPHDGRVYASWGLKELLQLFDQLPEDLRAVEDNERFRRYLVEMVEYGNRYLLESAETNGPPERQESE